MRPVFLTGNDGGELTERAVANLPTSPMRWMTYPADAPDYAMDRVTAGSRLLAELPLFIDDQCGLSLDDVVSRTTQAHMRRRLRSWWWTTCTSWPAPGETMLRNWAASPRARRIFQNVERAGMALHQLNRSNAGFGRESAARRSLDYLAHPVKSRKRRTP